MRLNGQTTFENISTNQNSHFGPKHDVFGLKFWIFAHSDQVYGHILAQNDALVEAKKLCYPKKIRSIKNSFLGPKWHFWEKTSSFGALAIFICPKIS